LTSLTPAELATLRSLASTFVPAADAERVAGIAADALGRAVDPAQLTQLRLVLRLLEQPVANLATGAGFAAFRDMTPEARERTLLRWIGSPIVLRRSGVHAFRKLLTFIAYADPGTPERPNRLPRRVGYRTNNPRQPSRLAPISPLVVDRSPAPQDDAVELEADVVVVGSGAGGGVVAAELARAGRSVLVVEAGPFVDEATVPRDELDAYGRLYLNYGLLSTWDGSITLLAGSAVGGGTLVNWMTCLDAPADVRAEWAGGHGLDGIDGPEWAGDVEAIETRLGVAPATVIPPKDELIRRGAAALGWDAGVIRRNAAACGNCGSCPFGCRRGTKQSGIRAHLADAVADGARVLDRARVRSIIREGGARGRVIGVAGTLAPELEGPAAEGAPPRWFSVYARQVVLAAGALRSPAILQASGIGHASIGRHLRIHPVPIIGALHETPIDMWQGTMQAVRSLEFGQDEPGRRRYVVESAPGHLGLLALVLPWMGAADHAALMARARHFSPLIAITRDGGEGRTQLTKAGRVRIDYRLDDDGRATLRHALVSMARLARAGGVAEILGVGSPLRRHRVDAGPDESQRFAAFERSLAETDFAPHRGTVASAHQMGTVRAGADPADHPADPRGRIRADSRGSIVPGLYVADTSTFPTGLGVNPMITVMAMARRVARTVLAEGSTG
jgi:choline dehydrogenase-like flavoprotein